MANAAPTSTLHDAQGRTMRYLRLSVTDRCNFRCQYCSPASWGGKKDLLTTDEIVRIVRLFGLLGIERVRLTGGEPLLRPDLLDIVRRIRSEAPSVRHIALTSNASRLAELALPLRAAGLDHLNVSLDTLDAATFRSISPRGELDTVLQGIDAAVEARYPSLKLNVVVLAGVNDTEVPALVRYAHARNITPRFIELMPFGKGTGVPTRLLIERLKASGFVLDEVLATPGLPYGPARYLATPEGHRIGFVSPMTENFCGGCNRVRVASNGDLRACLGGREQAPLSKLIRAGASDEELIVAVRLALGQKQEGHRFNEPGASSALLSMMGIGG